MRSVILIAVAVCALAAVTVSATSAHQLRGQPLAPPPTQSPRRPPRCEYGVKGGPNGRPATDGFGFPICLPKPSMKNACKARLGGKKGPCMCNTGAGCLVSAFCQKNGGKITAPTQGFACPNPKEVCCSIDWQKAVANAKAANVDKKKAADTAAGKPPAPTTAPASTGSAEGGPCGWTENAGYVNEKIYKGTCRNNVVNRCPMGSVYVVKPGSQTGCDTVFTTEQGGKLQCCARPIVAPKF